MWFFYSGALQRSDLHSDRFKGQNFKAAFIIFSLIIKAIRGRNLGGEQKSKRKLTANPPFGGNDIWHFSSSLSRST